MSQSKFPPSFFKRNRQNLLSQCKSSVLVIPAHKLLQRNCDGPYPFRQESNFWYLSGVETPDVVLVITKQESWLIVPHRDWVENVFDGAIDDAGLQKTSAVDNVYPEREGWSKLDSLLKKHKKVGVLKPMQAHRFDVTPNPARRDLIAKLRRRVSGLQFEDVRMPLAVLRMIKQPQEIDVLQRAIDITTETLSEVFASGWRKKYKHEYEIEADITAGFRRRGASGHGFSPVVASGQNTCTLHHVENNSRLDSHGLLLLDIGAEVSNYTADISRTLSVSPRMTPRQQEVFDAVDRVREYALGLLKPGQDYIEYEKLVEKRMGEELQQLGELKRQTRKQIRQLFPHRASHSLGLDAHDPADYYQPLQEGMILTIEPGIYLPDEGIGVRIEDDILITKNDARVMSKDLPVRLS